MSKHTPGPWMVVMDSRDCPGVRGKGGFVAFTPSVQHYGDPARYFEECDERADNARLIAAAPELLAAIESIGIIATESVGCIDTIDYSDDMNRIISIVRAAIAKAEGEA